MTDPNDRLRDFLSALLFAIVGVGAIAIALDYPLGTLRRIGPGALPLMLGVLLTAAGVVLAVQVWLRSDAAGRLISMPSLPRRPMIRAVVFVTLSLIAFAVLIRPMGLLIATATLAVVARQAEPGATLLGTIVIALMLALLCSAIFVWAIGLPIRVWP